jgi:hypothetical protein
MNDDGSRRDLAPLDPTLDRERWEGLVTGINRAAAFELARRARQPTPGVLVALSTWRRPAAAASFAIAAGAAAVLLLGPAPVSEGEAGMAQAIGYPDPVASWVETGVSPSVEELLFVLEAPE